MCRGWLFQFDLEGGFVDKLELGEGASYHPGGKVCDTMPTCSGSSNKETKNKGLGTQSSWKLQHYACHTHPLLLAADLYACCSRNAGPRMCPLCSDMDMQALILMASTYMCPWQSTMLAMHVGL